MKYKNANNSCWGELQGGVVLIISRSCGCVVCGCVIMHLKYEDANNSCWGELQGGVVLINSRSCGCVVCDVCDYTYEI